MNALSAARRHFSPSPKAICAAVVAVLGILAAFDLVGPKAAAALGAAVAPILALFDPKDK